MSGGGDEDEKPIGELFSDLIDNAEAYAKAELRLAKAEVESKVDSARKPALLGATALLFLTAGVVVLCMTMALALGTLVGPLAGGLIAAAITFGIAYGVYMLAIKELEKLK